jgi:hypothetical protein
LADEIFEFRNEHLVKAVSGGLHASLRFLLKKIRPAGTLILKAIGADLENKCLKLLLEEGLPVMSAYVELAASKNDFEAVKILLPRVSQHQTLIKAIGACKSAGE